MGRGGGIRRQGTWIHSFRGRMAGDVGAANDVVNKWHLNGEVDQNACLSLVGMGKVFRAVNRQLLGSEIWF